MGALMATAVWAGLSVLPNLWMLVLWLMAAAIWAGRRLFRVKPSAEPPSFWLNALMTMLILLGPAIEDSADGKDVYAASAFRVTLFVGVALYAWAVVWVLERWRAARTASAAPRRG
jgi:FtsH-binding integral membrane protein